MKNIFKTLSLVLACMATLGLVNAQDISFTQYHNTPLFTNTAMVGSYDSYRAFINYRSQRVQGDNLTTGMGTFSMPFYANGRRVAGLGVTVLRDDMAKGLINSGALLGGAYNIKTGDRSVLGIGLQGGYMQSRIDVAGKTTDAQWINGIFNPNAPTGEKLSGDVASYITAGGGLMWYMPDERYRQRVFVGVSGFNLNQPELKFFSANPTVVARRIVGVAGVRVFKTQQFSIMPNARVVNFSEKTHANIGSWFRHHMPMQANGTATDISVGLWYNTNGVAAASIEVENRNLIAALSFDLPMRKATNTFTNNGIFELTLGFKIPHKKGPKDGLQEAPMADASEEEKKKQAKQDSAFKANLEQQLAKRDSAMKVELTKTVTENVKRELSEQIKKETNDIVNSKLSEVDKRIDAYNDRMIRMERNFFKRNIRFELGSKALSFESRQILADVIKGMRDNPSLKLELVGHSCDIGEQEGNRRLSFERAEAVKKYLVDSGVDANRITTRGEGVNNPFAPNTSEMNRRLNRRVEFITSEK
jgi:type IX secretion system PorP/SprF family membrane protein